MAPKHATQIIEQLKYFENVNRAEGIPGNNNHLYFPHGILQLLLMIIILSSKIIYEVVYLEYEINKYL